MLYLGISGRGDRLTKLFGGHKPCYDGHRPLTSRYFKRCDTGFFAHPHDQRAVTGFEDVRQLNIRRGKKLAFQLSHAQPLR